MKKRKKGNAELKREERIERKKEEKYKGKKQGRAERN